MRVLVTGGAGFIGSHVSEALLERGDEVWALDDLSTGRTENLKSFERNPRFRFLEEDVTNSALVSGLVAQCDRIYHLAAAVGVKYVLETPSVLSPTSEDRSFSKPVRPISAGSSCSPAAKCTEKASRFHSPKTTIACSGQHTSSAGPTRAAKRSTNAWLRPTGSSSSCL